MVILRHALFICLCLCTYCGISQKNADCIKAKEICKKGTHEFARASGEGRDQFESFPTPCFENGDVRGNAEMNSVWIRLKIAKSGSLKFTIRPSKYDDDLDFVVYKLPDGECSSKRIVRCMAAGDKVYPSFCMGATGLRDGERDISEDAGCDGDKNGYLKPLSVKEGEEYVILVSNVTSEGEGFSIRFYGSCMLPCDEEKKPEPTPKLESKPVEAEATVVVEQEKTTPTIQVQEPEKQPETKVEPPITQSTAPAEIEGRKTIVNKTIGVSSRKVTLKVWDNSVEDGDIISIYINGVNKYPNIILTTKPQEFPLELDKGENFITAHVESFGKREPNTAAILVNDGKRSQKLTLSATRNQEETMKITVE